MSARSLCGMRRSRSGEALDSVTSLVFAFKELAHLVSKVINSGFKRREINVRQIRGIIAAVAYINEVTEAGIGQRGRWYIYIYQWTSSRTLWEAFPLIIPRF